MRTLNPSPTPLATAVAALAAALPPAVQADPVSVDFHGYFRSGIGASTQGGDQVCFQLPGAPRKYRLGNECETYGELSFGSQVYKAPGGTTFRFSTMAAFVLPNNLDWEQFTPSWREVFVEADKIGAGAFANASLWAGKRYYDRHDVHINDFYFWSNSGPGAGIENIDVGVGRLSYALRRNGEAGTTPPASAAERQLIGHDLRWKDIPTNPNGSLTIGLDWRKANSRDGVENTGGSGLTLMHTQKEIFGGGYNKLALQYGKGAIANLDHSFPSFGAAKGDKTWRIVESVVWQPGGLIDNLSGMATVVYEQRDIAGTHANGDSLSGKWVSFGVRPVYHFSDQVSAAVEAGYDQFKPDAGARRRLAKLTLAAQYGAGRNFWSRPVIRAFATHAKWSSGAQAAAAPGDALSTTGAFSADTSGTTYGVQAEIWW